MADTKRKDVLAGLENMTPGPYRVVGTAFGNCIGAALGPAGGKTLYIQSQASGGFQEANAEGFARAPELVEEVRELRAVLSECAKQLAATGADAHASRARALLPDTEDE